MNINNFGINTLDYLERYVNDGSPSGFTELYSTSENTKASSNISFYYPYICFAKKECVKTIGYVPNYVWPNGETSDSYIVVHPDMVNHEFFEQGKFAIKLDNSFTLIPTSSGRTVKVNNWSSEGYFKLHYDGILGRIKRDLTFKKAISGVEISTILTNLKDRKLISDKLTFFPEPGARIISYRDINGVTKEWGMLWRESCPYLAGNEVRHIIPMFALFSKDSNSVHDQTILEQLINKKNCDPLKFVLDELILPLLNCYFDLILVSGIQPEWHAQNLLLGINENFEITKFIMRDLESMDKDLTLMSSLGLNTEFESFPFKCICSKQYNYQIKHSFMFDYKFGEYTIAPILNLLHNKYDINLAKAYDIIKSCSRYYLDKLPNDFFPEGKWYSFENILINQDSGTRPYIENTNLKFR